MRTRRSRGVVLIVTLAVLAGLMIVLAGAVASGRLNIDAQINGMESQRAKLAAEAGVQYALATLATQSKTATSAKDPWMILGSDGSQAGDQNLVVGDISFRVQVIDAGSLININTATQLQLQKLPLTAEQIDSLLDWRSGGQTPRPDGGKDAYYNALDNGYDAKLRALNTVDELLLIKGFTAKDIYEAPTNITGNGMVLTDANGRQLTVADLVTTSSSSQEAAAGGRLNVNTNKTAQAYIQRGISRGIATQIATPGRRFATYGQLLGLRGVTTNDAKAILTSCTFGGATAQTGKINLNTATGPVLESLPSLTPDIATSIVTHQSTGFTSLGDLATIPGMTVPVLQQTVDSFTVSSTMFIVRVIGRAGNTTIARQAYVNIAGATPVIQMTEDEPFPDVATRWNWADQTSADVVLSEGQ